MSRYRNRRNCQLASAQPAASAGAAGADKGEGCAQVCFAG
jgi:hypothetical protein